MNISIFAVLLLALVCQQAQCKPTPRISDDSFYSDNAVDSEEEGQTPDFQQDISGTFEEGIRAGDRQIFESAVSVSRGTTPAPCGDGSAPILIGEGIYACSTENENESRATTPKKRRQG
jgi:hypothetical protein